MAKSAGDFLRMQTLIDHGYDPLAYRYFCIGAHYRGKLSFTWEALDGAATALQRMRLAAYEWGAPGEPEVSYVNRFKNHVDDDLNMPRALALAWELIRSDLPAPTKKATLLQFDPVLGLELADWQPEKEAVPGEITALVERREKAHAEKRYGDAEPCGNRLNRQDTKSKTRQSVPGCVLETEGRASGTPCQQTTRQF